MDRYTHTRPAYISNSILLGIVLIGFLAAIPFIRQPLYVFCFVAACGVFLMAFTRTVWALIFLIFAMLFSPEFSLGHAGGRDIVVRFDDIFIGIIAMGWLAKLAVNKELGLLRFTPINKYILLYFAVGVVASLWSSVRGVGSFKGSFFYILKYFEYYLIFFMVSNNVTERKQVKLFVWCLLAVAFCTSLYAWGQHLAGIERVSAPFEGKSGEANTLGGYLLFMMAVAVGLFLNTPVLRDKIYMGIFCAVVFPAFLFTLSRGSWIGLMAVVLALTILSKHNRLLIFACLLAAILVGPFIMPAYVKDRITYTFKAGKDYHIAGRRVRIEDSAAARIEVWKYGFRKWLKQPIIGYGPGGLPMIVDNQYIRVILETGLVGLTCFGLIIGGIFTHALRTMRTVYEDGYYRGLIIGFLAGLVGILFHSFSAESFIIIRIMEPVWFVTALVMIIPYIPQVADASDVQIRPGN